MISLFNPGGFMKRLVALFALLASLLLAPAWAQSGPSSQQELQKLLEGLSPQSGKIAIPEAKASLDLGKDYLFYNASDARKILIDLWGNPPESVNGVLGMVMPAGSTPLSDTWGAVITFEDTGYVSDDDAADTDFDELLESLQQGVQDNNEARREAGYASMDLVGWAARPAYDAATHSVVWAQNLHFSDQQVNTLNYDVRTLGRYGVLSVNLVSTMPQLASVKQAAETFATHASFDPGARYEDFNASTDKAAEYGIGGLIAAGAGAAAAKKLGIFALLAKFIKPILLGVLVFFGALWGRIKRLFGMGGEESYDTEWDEYQADQGEDHSDAAVHSDDADINDRGSG